MTTLKINTHPGMSVKMYLDHHFCCSWICFCGPQKWPPSFQTSSPYINMWGHTEHLVYQLNVKSGHALQIVKASERGARMCPKAESGHYEHLL